MNTFIKPFTLAALLATTLPLSAQDSTEPTDETAAEETQDQAEQLDMGEEVVDENAPGTLYVQETSGDWEIRCVRTEDENDPCQAHQTLKGPEGNPVAEVSMFPLADSEQAVAGATIAVPLMTLLTEQVSINIDSSAAKRYNFTWCDPEGCYARIGFTADDIAAFKAGSAATVTIVPVAAPDQKVAVPMSLTGFTAAFDGLSAN